MRSYYEELWERLPEELDPPELDARLALLRSALRPGMRVLDLGCGAGVFTEAILTAGALAVGVDVAEAALARARRKAPGAELRRAEFDGPLPAGDGEFGLVWASEVLEHVADTHLMLSEIARVLEPGGRLLATTPNHSRLAILLGGIERYAEPLGDHLHLYTRRSLRETLRSRGFREVRVSARGGLPLLPRPMLVAQGRRP